MLPVPARIEDATTIHSVGSRGISTEEDNDLRVEKMPVPTILLMLRKRIVRGPTSYPKGDDSSTGAPEASG